MDRFVPESKQLKCRRTDTGWDAYVVSKTLILWYPDLLRGGPIHADMQDAAQALSFVACVQDYPADLQDILILMAQQHGIEHAVEALDNAIRKYRSERRREAPARPRPGKGSAKVIPLRA